MIQARGVFRNDALTCDKYYLVGKMDKTYPYLLDEKVHPMQSPAQITGEVYEVDDAGLEELDSLEDHPDYYCRRVIQVINTKDGTVSDASAYLLVCPDGKKDIADRFGIDYENVQSGDWIACNPVTESATKYSHKTM
jgi:gamma-glutamylcyclotransferase (GGCT)/AIG2-like uncharacterized protein YtfP